MTKKDKYTEAQRQKIYELFRHPLAHMRLDDLYPFVESAMPEISELVLEKILSDGVSEGCLKKSTSGFFMGTEKLTGMASQR